MSINFAQFPQPRLPLQGNDLVVGYQLIGSVPTLAQYTLTQMFAGVFPGGVVPVSNGGTGLSTVPAGDLLVGTGTNTMNFIIPGAAGAMLISQGTSVSPQFGNNPIITGGSITNTPISGSTGAFTTLSTPSATITGGTSNGMVIGNSTQAGAAFTTLIATGIIMPNQTAGIQGTTTNNNANAGSVGEHVTATGTSVALTSNVAANVTSISLTAGDWEVMSSCAYTPAVATAPLAFTSGASATSLTFPLAPFVAQIQLGTGAFVIGALQQQACPSQRFSLAATTTIFLVAQSAFSGGTMAATGTVRARRIR